LIAKAPKSLTICRHSLIKLSEIEIVFIMNNISKGKIKVIGLVTWIGSGNYGTTLQSFALHEKLRLLGYDVFIIGTFKPSETIKRVSKYLLGKIGIRKYNEEKYCRYLLPYGNKLYKFQNENYNRERPLLNSEFKKIVNRTDVFVTGSDQIWNVTYDFNPFMFLDFAGNKKRVAYASSIGISYIPDKYRDQIKILLTRFAHIGVREQTAVKVLSDIVGRNDIVQVLDPTFLLTHEEWIAMSKSAVYEMLIPEKFILCYLIGKNDWYQDQLKNVVKKSGIENIIIIPSAENTDFMIEGASVYKFAGPKEFVNLVQRSTLVCTDSFHATAISINLSKKFVEFLRFKDTDGASQNSRIYDLLNHFHLKDRLYDGKDVAWIKDIDYTGIQNILEKDRKRSIEYLVNSIEQ